MRILLVESNLRAARTRTALLAAERFVIEHADTGESTLELLRHYEFDLVLLNLNLPDMEGSLLISRLRAAGHDTPVLALTLSSQPRARVKALSAGGDDVVEYDVDQAELVARIRAIVRRSRGHSNSILSIGALALDLEQRETHVNGDRVKLTTKEFDLLQLLMLRKNAVLNKEAILSHLYGGLDEPEMKIIDVFICKLRSKLAKAGLPNLISTVWGRGYSICDTGRDEDTSDYPTIPQSLAADQRISAFA